MGKPCPVCGKTFDGECQSHRMAAMNAQLMQMVEADLKPGEKCKTIRMGFVQGGACDPRIAGHFDA